MSPTAAFRRVFTRSDAEAVARKVVALARRGERHATKLLFDVLDPVETKPIAVAIADGQIEVEQKSKKPIDFGEMEKLAAKLFGFPPQSAANGEQAAENFER